MKLWQRLYALIWLAFWQIVVAVFALGAPDGSLLLYALIAVHVVLGLAILGWTHIDLRELRKLAVPDRLKRIAASTARLAEVQLVLGAILLVPVFVALPGLASIPLAFLGLLHLVVALAIITQASSVATAYDMWEEKEFAPAPATA